MNMLVGIALHVLPEEDTFWCLVTILQKLMPENYFSGSLLGAIADQMVLSDLIKEKIPRLGQHMERFGIEPHLICLNWFITVFADVMPTDMVLKIWDTFLLDGRKTLFRYSLAILHVHEHILLTKDDPILLHNYIRTVCSHWIDFELLKSVAFTKFKAFPKSSKLDELHKTHLTPLILEHEKKEIKIQQKKKTNIPISHSKLLMPQSSSSIMPKPSNASLKSRDQRRWECGAVLPISNRGYLLCASDREHTSLFMVQPDNNSENLEDKYACRALDLEIGSDVTCAIEVNIFWIIGTSNGMLYGIDRVSQQMLWKCDLKESLLCIFSPVPSPSSEMSSIDRLYLGLANGKLHSFTLEGLPTKLTDGLSLELFPSDMVIVGLGNEPISCLESPGDGIICCGVGGRICVFETDTSQQMYEMIVSSEKRRSIREMRTSKHGLWVSLKGSCNILLYRIERDSHALIYRIDYNSFIQPSVEFVKSSSGHSTLPLTKKEARATALLATGDELWIGTHNGNLLVFDVKKEEKDALKLVPRLDHSSSLFQVSDEFPLEWLPNSDERQVVTNLSLSIIKKVSNHPVRVLLDCFTGEHSEVLSASGAVGEKGSVRIWSNKSTQHYESYHLPIKPFAVFLNLPPSGQEDEYMMKQKGFDYCGIFFTSETPNDTSSLSPITENVIDDSEVDI